MKKFEDTIYEEVDDSTLKNFILGMYVDELKNTHIVTQLVYLPKENKWLVKLQKDYIKAMQSE